MQVSRNQEGATTTLPMHSTAATQGRSDYGLVNMHVSVSSSILSSILSRYCLLSRNSQQNTEHIFEAKHAELPDSRPKWARTGLCLRLKRPKRGWSTLQERRLWCRRIGLMKPRNQYSLSTRIRNTTAKVDISAIPKANPSLKLPLADARRGCVAATFPCEADMVISAFWRNMPCGSCILPVLLTLYLAEILIAPRMESALLIDGAGMCSADAYHVTWS